MRAQMKKSILLGLIFIIGLVLSGCDNTTSLTDSHSQKTIDSLKAENEEIKAKSSSQSTNTEESSKLVGDTFKEKTLPVVGILEYTISSIKTEQVKNNQNNFTNAEYNFSRIKDFPETYYRTTISYKLKNTATVPFSLSTYQASLIDGDGMEYSRTGEYFLYDENSNSLVQPETTTSGTFYLLSENKPNLDTFKLNVSKQYTDDYTVGPIGEAGTTEYK